MKLDPEQLIRILDLRPHPEGGFYTETFRSSLSVDSAAHPAPRSASTAIYFLLRKGDFSAFHRVRSDEVWHHYAGDALELFLLEPRGALSIERLGNELSRGERPQAIAARNVLQAARPDPAGTHGFVLCGCTVAPGFDFADFEMPSREDLTRRYAAHASLFAQLCRDPA